MHGYCAVGLVEEYDGGRWKTDLSPLPVVRPGSRTSDQKSLTLPSAAYLIMLNPEGSRILAQMMSTGVVLKSILEVFGCDCYNR